MKTFTDKMEQGMGIEGVDYFRVSDRLPGNDRCVLVFAERYFGPDRWQPLCYVGTDLNDPGDERPCWMDGAEMLTQEEVQVEFWREMIVLPEPKNKFVPLPRI